MKKVKFKMFKTELVKLLILTIALFVGFSSAGSAAAASSLSIGKTKTVNVQGQNPVEVTVLQDDKQVRIVKTHDTVTNETFTTTFNKTTQSIVSIDKNGLEKFNSIKEAQKLKAQQVITTYATLLNSNQDRTGKYKYYYYTGKVWVLMAPDRLAKNPIEKSSNSSNILSFRNSVNTLRQKQADYAAALAGMTGSVALAVATATSTLGWSFVLGALAAIGFGATALAQASAVNQATKDSMFYFDRVTL